MQDFDKLWNMSKPAETETKFREVLENGAKEKDLNYKLELLTQIARTYGLRFMFAQAHELLDQVEAQLSAEPGIVHVRYNLERGRSFNSAGDKEKAKIYFDEATAIAKKLGDDFYVLDAMHMQAIAARYGDAVRINEEALLLAESSTDKRAKNWLGPLYNNLGWDYFDKGEYEKALSIFLRSVKRREELKQPREVIIAKWTVARTLRALGRNDEALKIQLGLFEETVASGYPDGYIHEELGELFLLQNDTQKATFHFEKAYNLLHTDPFVQQNEKERLERMKSMAGIV
jgi:tetratricopeptide (TPR) repeat protein